MFQQRQTRFPRKNPQRLTNLFLGPRNLCIDSTRQRNSTLPSREASTRVILIHEATAMRIVHVSFLKRGIAPCDICGTSNKRFWYCLQEDTEKVHKLLCMRCAV